MPFVVRTRPSATGAVAEVAGARDLHPAEGRPRRARAVHRERPRRRGRAFDRRPLQPAAARTSCASRKRRSSARPPTATSIVPRRRGGDPSRSPRSRSGARYGLTVDATLAPLTDGRAASISARDRGAPKTRVREVPARATGVAAVLRSLRREAAGAWTRRPGRRETPLFTADGQQVELDLVVRVQGQHDDFTPAKIAPAMVAAAAAHLREHRVRGARRARPACRARGGDRTAR